MDGQISRGTPSNASLHVIVSWHSLRSPDEKNAFRIFTDVETSYCVFAHSYRDKGFLNDWGVFIYLFSLTLLYFSDPSACNICYVIVMGSNEFFKYIIYDATTFNSNSYYVLSYEEK